MGGVGMGELLAALYTASFLFVLLLVNFLYFKYALKDPAVAQETFLGNVRLSIETHADMTSYLTLLLATLGIMIGLFTVTGFINRMGGMLLDLGSWSMIAMIGMSFIFGWLVGMGLPPTATYIIGAVVIVGPLTKLGVNPWVAHFFVFLLSVWGELSPPTSLTAAISAKIAEADFMHTMWEALRICLPITLMTFAIFSRSEMVVTPGWTQVGAVAGRDDRHLRDRPRDVRAADREQGWRPRAANGPHARRLRRPVLPGRQGFGGHRRVRTGGDRLRRRAPSAHSTAGPAGAAGGLARRGVPGARRPGRGAPGNFGTRPAIQSGFGEELNARLAGRPESRRRPPAGTRRCAHR